MLLAYQSNSITPSSSHSRIPSRRTQQASEAGHRSNDSSQWHEFVDRSMIPSLGKEETHRQGLWFEVISGEMDYVRDLKMLCDEFIAPLRTQQPPVIQPQPRMEAFVREVFSTTQGLAEVIGAAKAGMAISQWTVFPSGNTDVQLTSAADILLTGFFEMADLYEKVRDIMDTVVYTDSLVHEKLPFLRCQSQAGKGSESQIQAFP
jgi:hypothetical protein